MWLVICMIKWQVSVSQTCLLHIYLKYVIRYYL